MLAVLATSFAIGFLGSFHCVGMCGGLVTTMTMARPRIWWPGLMAYQVGRISTYAFLGLVTGIIGIVLSKLPGFSSAQNILTAAAGIMMIAFGLHIGGWVPDPFKKITSGFMRISRLGNWLRSASTSDSPMSWFIVGFLNGFLPCGLVYAGLTQSLAVGNVPMAALIMIAFGLGTVPAMTLTPLVLKSITPINRARILKLAAFMLIALGLLTIFRGSDWLHSQHDSSGTHTPTTHAPTTADHSNHTKTDAP
jgi:sulfite exporter TauE/SafE